MTPEVSVIGLRGAEARRAHRDNLAAILAKNIFPADEAKHRTHRQKKKDGRRFEALRRILVKEARLQSQGS